MMHSDSVEQLGEFSQKENVRTAMRCKLKDNEMKRSVLVVPKTEILKHLDENSRKDVKVVVPEILTDALFTMLRSKGKSIKQERALKGITWKHSGAEDSNSICESGDFMDDFSFRNVKGAFALSFVNEQAVQDEHFHSRHIEIYISEHTMSAIYRITARSRHRSIHLGTGGAIIFGPGVIHKVTLGGLTFVLEVPSVTDDKSKHDSSTDHKS